MKARMGFRAASPPAAKVLDAWRKSPFYGANRLNIAFRTVPGAYRAKVRAAS